MYAYYHEHFEICEWDGSFRVTCICGNDFVWSALPNTSEHHRCPHCSEYWDIKYVGYSEVFIKRVKTSAEIKLSLSSLIRLVKS